MAVSTSQKSVPNNSFTARSLIAPTNLTAPPVGHDVTLSWTAGQNGSGYSVLGVANGTSSNCSGALFSNIGSTASTSYSDTGRYTPQGNYFCYQVQTTYGNWTSTTSNPIAATQIGFVATSVQMINNGDHSGCSGSGNQLYGQAGYLDCGDQLVINFNQAVNTATGPTSSDTVCASNTLLLGSTVTSGVCPTELVVSGSYTGNGVNARSITGLGFQPDVVLIKDTTTDVAVIRTSTMSGDATKPINAAISTNMIESLDVDGFTVGTSTRVNGSTRTYHWIAFKQALGEMKVGSYSGSGADNRSITGVGFQPDYVIVLPASASVSVHRSSAMVGDTSSYFTAAASAANIIQALEADGFQIGTNATVNTNGTTYYYIAWKAISGKMIVGTYTGNGVDNRNITGVGFQPEWALVKDTTTDSASHKPASTGASTDTSLYFTAAASVTNRIQLLQADGYQVGTGAEVNTGSNVYFWSAFARIPAEPLDLGTLSGGTVGGCNCRFNASYAWSNGNKTLTVTIGTRVTGSAYPSISAATWTFYPTGTSAKLQSTTGGFHICDNNTGSGNCLPSTVGGSTFLPARMPTVTRWAQSFTPMPTKLATTRTPKPTRTPSPPPPSSVIEGTRTFTPTPRPTLIDGTLTPVPTATLWDQTVTPSPTPTLKPSRRTRTPMPTASATFSATLPFFTPTVVTSAPPDDVAPTAAADETTIEP